MAPTSTPEGGSSFPILDPPEREGWLEWLRGTLAGLGPVRMIGATLSLAAMAALVSVLWFQPTASGSFGGSAPGTTAAPTAVPTLNTLPDPTSTSLVPVVPAQATAPSAAITGDATPFPTQRASAKPTPKSTAKPTATPTATAKPTPSPSSSASASPSPPQCSPLITPCPSPSG